MTALSNTDRSSWLDALEPRLASQLRFLIEADRLKSVVRACRISDGSRKENTAEHSWHIALFATVLAEHSSEPIDVSAVVRMLIVHDLVEIEAGDVPLFSDAPPGDQSEREVRAAEKIFGLLPDDQARELRSVWEEFEAAETANARFAKSIDRLQPIVQNHLVGGGTWTDYDVDEATVRAKTGYIVDGSATLWQTAEAIMADAVHRGWLKR